MAHQPTLSANTGASHAISLKVLRLSRPSLATQTALPSTNFGSGLDIPSQASLAYPSSSSESAFPLTPLLTLPAAFGAAYVGETFTCTLCANNEVRPDEARSVSGVRIAAELQTPSNRAGAALELVDSTEDDGTPTSESVSVSVRDAGEMAPGATLQRTLRHEMKEEGQHVLAVTVTYTETLRGSDGGASGGRVRTFRKLYQFVSQSLVAVRSKVTERKRRGKGEGRQWVLEAQLENVGEASVVLEKVWLNERLGIGSYGVNGEEGAREAMVLKPQDVEQVMFVLREEEEPDDLEVRVPLAQLNVDWRSAMGERGSLTTGWLASRGK